MRVLFWLDTYLPEVGGVKTFCSRLIPELQARGHEVGLLSAHTNRDAPDHELLDGVPVTRLDSLRPLIAKAPAGIMKASREIERFIADFQPDVLHTHPGGPELIHFLRLDARRHVPTVLTVHNNHSSTGINFGPESLFGRAFASVERIAAVSEDSATWLRTAFPDLAPRISTILNGIPAADMAPTELPWDPPRLLWAGRFAAQKRPDVMIDAFAAIAAAHPSVTLRMLGAGELLDSARSMATSLGLDDRLEVVGPVPPASMQCELHSATALVMSSDFEGLPMVTLEAAQAGRPVVGTAVGGMGEIVEHERTGLLVPSEDPASLGAAVLELLSNRTAAEAMGAEASIRVDRQFSLARCADAYVSLYEEAVVGARCEQSTPPQGRPSGDVNPTF